MACSWIPSEPMEIVPYQVDNLLTGKFGWSKQQSSGKTMYQNGRFPNVYFSWSEALILELGRTFVELS